MKKLVSVLVLLVLLVAGLWGATTYWFGIKAEQQYLALLQQASQWQQLKFVSESYTRGFYQSQARSVIEIQLPPGTGEETQAFKINLAHEILHGPFPLGTLPDGQGRLKPVMAVIETRLVPGPELQSYLAELWTQVPELASLRDVTVIYLDGEGRERFVIPAFQHTFGKEEPVAATWKGLTFQADFTADLKAISGSLHIPGAEGRGKGFELRLGEVKFTFTTQEGVSGLWLGDLAFSLANLEFTLEQETGPQSLLLRGFKADTATKASGDTLNCLVTLRTEQLKLDDTQYGPGVFELELRNLDAPTLARLQQDLKEEQAQPRRESSEAAQMKTLSRYLAILPDLLKKSPELEIRQLDFKTSMGDFSGKARLAFDGTKAGPVASPVALIAALTAQAELRIGEGLLRSVLAGMLQGDLLQEWEDEEGEAPDDEVISAVVSTKVDEQLATLVAQNLLVKENGTYAASARYEAGQITLNGRPMSFQDLIQ